MARRKRKHRVPGATRPRLTPSLAPWESDALLKVRLTENGVPFVGSTCPLGAIFLQHMGKYRDLDLAVIDAAAGAYAAETLEAFPPTMPDHEWIVAMIGRGSDLCALLVGFVTVKDDCLGHVWVAPNARRHGLARALCEAAMHEFPSIRYVEGPTSPDGEALRRELELDVHISDTPTNQVKSKILAAGMATKDGPLWAVLPSGGYSTEYAAAMVAAGLLDEDGKPTAKALEAIERTNGEFTMQVVPA